MRVLYVHDCFGTLAGAEASVAITASELAARGHQLAILHGSGTGKNEAAWQALFPTRFPLYSGHSDEVTRRALEEFQPDAVYVNKMGTLPVLEVLVASGAYIVRMVHDHDIYCMRSYKYHYFSRRICTRPASLYCIFPCMGCIGKNPRSALRLKWVSYRQKKREIALNQQIHRMIVVTHYTQSELLKNGFDPSRIVILPPIPSMGDASIRSNFSDRNLILYAGQIVRGKGVDVLLDALALLDMPFECIILGDGNHRAYCESRCRSLGLSDRVKFKGFVPQEELKAYYRECSVVAISSVWPEPIATIGLEVMRYGLPVVAFDAGGIQDWLTDGHNGFLVPWMDRPTYAKRLKQLLSDKPLARKMGESGLKRASERYDFEQYIDRLEAILSCPPPADSR